MLRILLKFGMPAIWLLVPLLAVYGWLSPWSPAAAPLARYGDQTPVLIGISERSHYSLQSHDVRSARSYVLFPSALSDPRIVTVVQEHGAAATVEESTSGFWIYLASLALYGVGTWWFWFRRTRPDASSKASQIHSS
ncbi:hypothetical protein GCM10025759_06970 [Lysobacter panacisoli]|uniref:PepSY domain-containing protein n=1 Tax=Lysobacter panacisoli TaxID=1255263 RepID=A0ABP9L634_9GAMM